MKISELAKARRNAKSRMKIYDFAKMLPTTDEYRYHIRYSKEFSEEDFIRELNKCNEFTLMKSFYEWFEKFISGLHYEGKNPDSIDSISGLRYALHYLTPDDLFDLIFTWGRANCNPVFRTILSALNIQRTEYNLSIVPTFFEVHYFSIGYGTSQREHFKNSCRKETDWKKVETLNNNILHIDWEKWLKDEVKTRALYW